MRFAQKVRACLLQEMECSPVSAVFGGLAGDALCVCVTRSRTQSLDIVNDLAPEHLQLMTKTCRQDLRQVRNAGAVFLGANTPVALGDYYIGTHHVLPTGGNARFASALGVADFQKRVSVAEVAEGFVHHALSVERRAP